MLVAVPGELREVLGWEHVAGEGERPGLVERIGVNGGPTELGCHSVERAAAVDAGGTHERGALARTEVVLGEVVGQQQAVGQEVAGDGAVLFRRPGEPVEDAAERPAEQAVVLRALARLDELAAFVEVVAQRQRQVLLALGDGDVGDGAEQERVGERVLRVLHQPVVARLPHHGVEVAEHAERVRDTLGVHVPGGMGDVVGVEGGGVLVDVLRPRRARRGTWG